eukprot:UN17516
MGSYVNFLSISYFIQSKIYRKCGTNWQNSHIKTHLEIIHKKDEIMFGF